MVPRPGSTHFAVLAYVVDYCTEHPFSSPTVDEISAHVGLNHRTSSKDYIQKLREEGYLADHPYKKRRKLVPTAAGVALVDLLRSVE